MTPAASLRLLLGILFLLAVIPCAAHDLRIARVEVDFPADGRFEISIAYDLDALLLGKDPGHMEAEDWPAIDALTASQVNEGLERISSQVSTWVDPRFDDRPAEFEVQFPDYEGGRASSRSARLLYSPQDPPRRILLIGKVPEDAAAFTWMSREMGNNSLNIRRAGVEGVYTQALLAGDRSSPYSLREAQPRQPLTAILSDYLVMGYRHILPDGLDHILFVLGLFLLSQSLRPLLWQITAFTLAHSLTLILAVYDAVSMPAFIVESFVALSIAYVAIENLFTRELHWWRPAVIFMFGLLHGLTFAGSLKEVGLPEDALLPSLLAFNVGVEFGQLSVVGLAFLAVGWFRSMEWYRYRIVYPASIGIATVALIWAVQKFTAGILS